MILPDGAQLWYMDNINIMHLFVNGQRGNGYVHSGAGQYSYAPEQFYSSEGRRVALDRAGKIILCASDYGFIWHIRFARMN